MANENQSSVGSDELKCQLWNIKLIRSINLFSFTSFTFQPAPLSASVTESELCASPRCILESQDEFLLWHVYARRLVFSVFIISGYMYTYIFLSDMCLSSKFLLMEKNKMDFKSLEKASQSCTKINGFIQPL